MKSFLKPLVWLAATSPLLLRAEEPTLLRWAPEYRSPHLTWNTDAPNAAKQERPAFLHIGAFGQELSRSMAKQSLSSEQVATGLNATFDSFLIDRDEQPEFAALAQHYLGTVKQMAGWPANLWVTPLLKPYDGAAYLPPSQEWGGEGFSNVLVRAGAAWEQSSSDVEFQATDVIDQLTTPSPAPEASAPEALRAKVEEGVAAWMAGFDAVNGGFGEAPRTPEPELLRLLLRHEGEPRRAALFTLDQLAQRSIRTSDGGIYRRATEATWEQPVKLLFAADQGRLALAYLDAFALTKEERFQTEAARLLEFLVKRLQNQDGSIGNGIDATQPEGAAVFTDTRAFSDVNGQALIALLSFEKVTKKTTFKAAAEKLTTHLRAQATSRLGLCRRVGSTVTATFQDVVWTAAALGLAGDANGQKLWETLEKNYWDAHLNRPRVIPIHQASLIWSLPPVPPGLGDSPSAEAATLLAAQTTGWKVPAALEAHCRQALLHDVSPTPRADLLLAVAQQLK